MLCEKNIEAISSAAEEETYEEKKSKIYNTKKVR